MTTCATCGKDNSTGATNCAACGSVLGSSSPFSAALQSGVRLQNGAFTVGKVLGQGGFGITYQGGDMNLRRHVAIKEFFPFGSHRQGTTLLPPHGVTQENYEQGRKDFMAEATTLARFNHPGIVHVHTVFQENNSAYMVMEHLKGETLRERLDRVHVLPEEEALQIIRQVCDALGQVHNAGLLHRDIKPDNIMLVPGTTKERAVLIDFGTARKFSSDKTQPMTALVTPGYAPLEQYGSQARFGPYTDIYALGATLYHCLTGEMPASAPERVSGVDVRAPHEVNPKISRAISNATMAAMGVRAADRAQSAQAFNDLLQAPAPPQNVVPATVIPDYGTGNNDAGSWTPVAPPPLPPTPITPLPPAPTRSTSFSAWWNIIWVVLVVWFGYSRIVGDPVAKDLKYYINENFIEKDEQRRSIVNSFETLVEVGDNDNVIRSGLRSDIIPRYNAYIQSLEQIDPQTDEVQAIHDRWINIQKRRQKAYVALANPNNSYISEWIHEFERIRGWEEDWFEKQRAMGREHGLTPIE